MGYSNLSVTDRNTDIPFFSSIIYNFTEADFGVVNGVFIPTFNWIQAFFDSSLTVAPYLCVWGGQYDSLNRPILSQVRFAFSGDKQNIKGNAIFASGFDIRGVAVTSTPIGVVPSTDLLEVKAWGGMQ